MKIRLFHSLSLCLAGVLLLFCLFPGTAKANSNAPEIGKNCEKILNYCCRKAEVESLQQLVDQSLALQVGDCAEWYILGLSHYAPSLNTSIYVENLKNTLVNGSFPPATRQKMALALVACGYRNEPAVTKILKETIGSAGIMTWIFGLHLLKNVDSAPSKTVKDAIDSLLSLQLSDGGWSIQGKSSDPDVTAMAIQALASYRAGNTEVQTSVDAALSYLEGCQQEDGSYMSYGVKNTESIAQVLLALSSMEIDPLADSRFMKNGHTVVDALLSLQKKDGSFAHVEAGETSDIATSQAFCALTAYWQTQNGTGSFYLWDSVRPSSVSGQSVLFSSYKGIAYVCIATVTVILMLVLYLCKKRNIKNYLFVLLLAAVASIFIFFTNFESKTGPLRSSVPTTPQIGTVTMSVCCDAVSAQCDKRWIPVNGILMDPVEIPLYEGDTVYDLLIRTARERGWQIDNRGVSGDSTALAYITGIQYLYEMDFGDLSGWMYYVNGSSPSVGCGACYPQSGDEIQWVYSLDLGKI